MLMLNPCTELAGDLAGAFSPVAFQRRELARVLPALDEWQEQACRAQAPGLLLLCGRQTGKSTFAALVAVQMIVKWSGRLVLLISPTLRQSSELFRKCMQLFDALAAASTVVRRTSTELQLANGSKIHSLPGGNPDAIRGYSAPDLIIEDEAAFVNDRTFVASRPMLATNPNGRHILLSTPYGRRGHFYERWQADDPNWSKIVIRSEDCPRISTTFLEGERRVLSDRAYQQEYLCRFLESASAVFPSDMIERLVDEGQRRHVMPNEAEITETKKKIRALETPEQQAEYIEHRGGLNFDHLMTDPGPWANMDDPDWKPTPILEIPDCVMDDIPAATMLPPGAPRPDMKVLAEYCRLSNELAGLQNDQAPIANRAQRLAEVERQLAEVKARPGFPHHLIKG